MPKTQKCRSNKKRIPTEYGKQLGHFVENRSYPRSKIDNIMLVP